MIAGDTNAWIHFLSDQQNRYSELMNQSMRDRLLVMPVPVLHELICYPGLNDFDRKYLLEFPRFAAHDQTWINASKMRREILKQNKKARAMDSLIAQICIDHQIPLISDDHDLKTYVPFGLKII